MKKKILAGASAVVVVVAVFGVPYYLGGKAEESLNVQHHALADTFFLEVKSHQYERGIFNSTETTIFRFRPSVLSHLGKSLPENVKTILQHPITMINHVHHQPFANGLVPVRAVVDTEFQYDSETEKNLKRFFGDQIPLSVHNVIALDGSGTMQIRVSPFDYEELSGIKLAWKGLTGDVDYANQFASFKTHFVVPQLSAKLADKGNLNIQDVEITTETVSDRLKIALGKSATKIGQFDVAWQQGIDYDVRLNDLINTVTDLQIGAFINPTGTVAPNQVSVKNLTYNTQTSEAEQGFINSQGAFTFEKLQYGDREYGPLNIDTAAEHINADSLFALKTKLAQISTETATNENVTRDKMLSAVRTEGAGIFTKNPIFKLRKFQFTAPTGKIIASGSLKFDGLQAADLADIKPLVAKMNAELNLDVSQNMVEDFAVSQMRSLFAVENPNDAQEQKEIDDTIKMLVGQTIDTMRQDGYLQTDNGAIKTQIVVENNAIRLNNQPFKLQSDEKLFNNLDDENAVPPQPETASEPQ